MIPRKSTKSEYRNPKQAQNDEEKTDTMFQTGKSGVVDMKEARTSQYDLEDRTFVFAENVRPLAKRVPKSLANIEDLKQVVRSSGSVGANYIEANESLSKKDFLMRIRICRKEAKETRYWLQLIDTGDDATVKKLRDDLIQEATELTNIFGAIIRKSI